MSEGKEALLQTTQIALSGDLIDFGIGQPAMALLPLDLLRRAALHRLEQPQRGLLQYGLEQGDGFFRRALSQFLTSGYGYDVYPEELFITNGVSQALDLICTLFTRPGDVIFVEEPSYFLALRIFADHDLRVRGIPVDEDGLIIEALEERLAREKPALLYTIPTFQNPTGATLPRARRQRLMELSQAHRFLIVADEVYHLLGYSKVPPLPLAEHVNGETVVSLGSFSKILAPGLRLGWMQAAPPLIERLAGSGLLESGGGLNPFASGIVRSALEKGWQDDHLRHLRKVYQSRAAALSKALRQHMSGLGTFLEPAGGFFIWLELVQTVDTADLLAAARRLGVGFQPGPNFSSQGGLAQHMRLCFAFYDAESLEAGVVRLKTVLDSAIG
jgi:DNA-binding transcriptional MocR family regulator